MPGPAVDGVWAAMGRPRAGHARPLQGGNFCSGRRPQRPAEGSRPLPTVLVEKQVPFGVLGGRGRTCPARLWMVYGWLWEGRGPGMPGPYRAAIFAAGGVLNVPRRGQDPSLQYLWKSRCLLVYWAVGAGHVRPGYGWCTGGYGKAAGRACPAPTERQFLQRGGRGGCGRPWEGPSKPLWPFAAAAHLHHSAGASVASGCAVASGCGAFASRYA